MNTTNFSDLEQKWPSTIVSRQEVGRFSGGLLHPRTLANLDCLGLGPKGRIRVGRKICYTVESLIEFITRKAVQL